MAETFESIKQGAEGKRLVLHVGCGEPNPEKLHPSFRGADWHEIRLDIDPSAQPDMVADMTDMSGVPDGAVQAVFSSHNLEHLYAHQVPVALAEMHRVLAPEGVLLITMPDLQRVAMYVAAGELDKPIYDSPAGPITAIDILYGFRPALEAGNHFMAHRTGFTAPYLGERLAAAGFTNLRLSRRGVNLWAAAYKYESGDRRRQERMEVRREKPEMKERMPGSPPLSEMLHPGQFGPNILPDELDIPPRMWEPLELKKS